MLAALVVLRTQLTVADEALKTKPLMRDFVGLNVHTVMFKPDLYRPVTRLVRDYHGFDWDVGEETDYAPQFPFARNRVNWQDLYGGWKKAGYKTDVCLMFDGTLPDKWKDLERDAFKYGVEFARFFGPSGQAKLAESVEIGNEPGKYDDASYRKLFENAARGMRQGDPKLLISTCATYARPSGDYHKNVETVKGLESLYDVINVHAYPELEGWPTWRRSFPEDSHLDWLTKIQEVIAWRDKHAGGKQIWLTEFGWDATTQPQAKEGTFKDWVGVTDTQQAQYLVRGLLTLAELDLDRAYIFWFNDDDKASVHGSSGLTRNYQPKPAFYAVAHLMAVLGDYRLARVATKQSGELIVYEFTHEKPEIELIWVVWSPTSEGERKKVRIRPPSAIQRAERMPISSGKPEEARWTTGSDGEVELEIDESPAYLWLRR